MPSTHVSAVPAAVALVVLLSACGGGDDKPAAALTASGAAGAPSAPFGSTGTNTSAAAPDPRLTELQQRWTLWAFGSSTGYLVMLDETGEHCDKGRRPDVFFLASSSGGTTTRRCAVPATLPVLVPLQSYTGTSAKDCDEAMRDPAGTVTVDGTEVGTSAVPSTKLTNPARGGEFSGYACGHWALLDPLSPGSHRVEFRPWTGGEPMVVTYELTVS